MENKVSLQKSGHEKDTPILDVIEDEPYRMQADSPIKTGDYQYLIDHLSDRSPGSKRDARSKGGYLITRGESSDSVLNSSVIDPYDQELKLLKKLNSGEYSMEQIDQYRKSLVQAKIDSYNKHTQKRKTQQKKNKAASTKLVKIGGKYRQHSQLDLVMAELAHSPLNAEEDLPSDHIKMSESLRRLRYDPNAPPLQEDENYTGGDREGGGAPESKSPVQERIEKNDHEEEINTDETNGPSENKSHKTNKYSVENQKASPFFDPSTGMPTPAKKVVPKGKDFAARHLKPDMPKATRRKVKPGKDTWMARVPPNWNSPEDTDSNFEHSASAKLPTRLRETCSKQFKTIVQFKQKSQSENSWKNIKKKHARDRRMLFIEDAKHRQSGIISPEASRQVGDLGESLQLSEDTAEVHGGAGSMLAFDMVGLMTLDELEDLSHDSDDDEHHLRDGSAAGLFGTESLEGLDVNSTDLVLLSDFTTPEDVLAGCLGKLLFADDRAVKVRPASAGIGGVSKGRISSPTRPAIRPHTALPNFVRSSNPISDYKGNPAGTNKRPVITRARPTADWFS
jgi:hypothetical protein